MNDILPYNEYLLVGPDGRCRGFTDYEGAKAYINVYYERYIDKNLDKEDYNDVTDIGGRDAGEAMCMRAGAEVGIFSLYKTDDFINKIKEDIVFEDEKNEIISQVLKKNIDFNITNYNLDLVLNDIEKIDIMEPYGQY